MNANAKIIRNKLDECEYIMRIGITYSRGLSQLGIAKYNLEKARCILLSVQETRTSSYVCRKANLENVALEKKNLISKTRR